MNSKNLYRRRANILGVGVDAIDMKGATEIVFDALENSRKGYVCVTGVHGVIESQTSDDLKQITNESLMTTPDGMPTVWVGRLQGHKNMRRVYGPDLMLEICRESVAKGYRHFFYGGNEGIAEQLAVTLAEMFPGIQIAGTYTPPFRPLTAREEISLAATVRRQKPDIFWVGLSTPKQEKFMAEYIGKLDTKVMLGVGAAFDVHTGKMQDSPEWIKRLGMQWFHRLVQEPRRLGKRYGVIVPLFIYKIFLQFAGAKKYQIEPDDFKNRKPA